MKTIQTVCGPVDSSALGITYLHEHLMGRPLKPNPDPDYLLDSEATAIAELRAFHTLGGRAVVEMSPKEYARDPEALRRISEASGVHVIATTGYIKSASADPFLTGCSVEALAEEMIADVQHGLDGTRIRAGVIKAGSSLTQITANEENVFQAAILAHKATGAMVSTHTEAGTMALEQVSRLKAGGVPPERILIGHMDRNLAWPYHLEVARTGVTLGYDQFGKPKYAPDAVRVEYIARLVKAGYRDQIAISGDLARRSYWENYGGGPGFAHILRAVVPMLRAAGLSEDDIEAILVRTPARLLGFEAAS